MAETKLISTHVDSSGPGRLELDRAELRVVAGSDRGAKFSLGHDSLLIGSADDCEIVLHDPTVSSHHAEISVGERGYEVRDLQSKNGTLLGQWPIVRAPLADRMRLKLGQTTLAVHALGGRHIVPLHAPGGLKLLIACSIRMRATAAIIEQLAPNDMTVLIEGETGTGKEVTAQTLHELSPRSRGPFVVFDCGGVQPSMLAAELFGHERGAFSSAHTARPGMFEEAHGGTLFLDEIGELPIDVQPMLLRAIETKTVRRVGSNRDLVCDVRVVAATNRNLEELVRQKRFRSDLYYRLAVGRVRLPPLRDRREDVVPLAERFCAELGATLTPEIVTLFTSYAWPGNVRELRNMVAQIAATPREIPSALRAPKVESLEEAISDGESMRPLRDARRLAGETFERRYLSELLARAEYSVTRAAELADVSRQMLTRLLARYGMRLRDRDPDVTDS